MSIVRLLVLGLSFGLVSAAAAGTEYFSLSDFQQLSAAQSVFTFDELAGGDAGLNGAEYVSSGLTIVNRDGLVMNLVTESPNPYVAPFNFASAPHVLSSNFKNASPYFTEAFGDNFDFIFDPPVHLAGLFIGNIFPGGTEVQFLAADGTVLAAEVFDGSHPGEIQGPGGPADNRIFYGLASSVAIERIRTVEPGNDSDGVVFDDVRFAIPKFADLDVDGAVGGADLAVLLGAWGRCTGCAGDLDGDGQVSGADLALLLGAWGT